MPNLPDFIAAANSDEALMQAIAGVKTSDPQTFAEEVTKLAGSRGYAFTAEEFLVAWQRHLGAAAGDTDQLDEQQLASVAGGTAATVRAHQDRMRAQGTPVPPGETTADFFAKLGNLLGPLKFW